VPAAPPNKESLFSSIGSRPAPRSGQKLQAGCPRYAEFMKTLVDIEPELYAAAERLAQAQQKSLGQVLSELLQRAVGLSAEPEGALATELERRNGFDVFPERTGPKATVESVRQLCR